MPGEPTFFEMSAPDTDRTLTFFAALLGWRYEATGGGAMITTPGLAGGIHPDPEASIQVFFSVDDLDAAEAKITELGGEVLPGRSDGPGGRFLYSCRDPQGVSFGLHEPAQG